MASPVWPSPLKSMARTTSRAARRREDRSGWRSGRPQARQARRSVFEPGLSATSDGRPPVVNIPTATLVGSLEARDRRRAGRPGDAVRPGPAR